jgi:hypothetical protein
VPSYPAIADANWTLGGSILTFAFPMILFVIAAAVLWVLFTRPDAIPWRPGASPVRSVSSSLAVNDPQPPGDRSPDGAAGPEAGSE